jgi:hypothetical protein
MNPACISRLDIGVEIRSLACCPTNQPPSGKGMLHPAAEVVTAADLVTPKTKGVLP